ncbi:MAG: hypothetical protein V1688_01165 [bacterium]
MVGKKKLSIAFLNMGAYNPSFEFHFGWPFAKEILVFNNKIHLIRKEEKFEDYSKNQFIIAKKSNFSPPLKKPARAKANNFFRSVAVS